MSEEVNICGIMYRVVRPEPWTAVFSVCDGSNPRRIMFHREIHCLWQVEPVDGWRPPWACHIEAMYHWCLARIGGERDEHERPADEPVIPHKMAFDPERRMTYCLACGRDMTVRHEYRSCDGAATPHTQGATHAP